MKYSILTILGIAILGTLSFGGPNPAQAAGPLDGANTVQAPGGDDPEPEARKAWCDLEGHGVMYTGWLNKRQCRKLAEHRSLSGSWDDDADMP